MQELINKLTERAGISHEQAAKVLDTVKDFVKEKFPMMSGAVDNLLGGDTAAPVTASPQATVSVDKEESPFDVAKDKLTNFLSGDKN